MPPVAPIVASAAPPAPVDDKTAADASLPLTATDADKDARERIADKNDIVASHPAGTKWSGALKMPTYSPKAGVATAPEARDNDDFYWDGTRSEPHAARREAILKAHPEIKKLMGPCPRMKWVVLATLVFQFGMCAALSSASWGVVVLAAYVVAGTLNHMMMMAIHEIAHNLAFRSPLANRLLAIVANLPMGIPAAATFRRYHLEHHKYQGEDVLDVDVPLRAEALFFRSTPGKLIWCILQPFFYALRPLFIKPKPMGFWEMATLVAVVGYDALLTYLFGSRALVYTVVGSLLGMGLHPVAGHFIAEHYVFHPGQETYSYYGPLNWVTFNVGYHNEHHDFSNIPGSRLPQVKAMAPEFYDSLPYYDSWTGVIVDFILNGDMCGLSRVKRTTLSAEQRQQIYERECRHSSWAVMPKKKQL